MLTPYETHNNQIGVRLSYLVADEALRHEKSLALIGYEACKKRAKRTPGFRLREGKGLGNESLLSWEHLPHDWRQILQARFGDPVTEARKSVFEKLYTRDAKASDFYSTYTLSDGKGLKRELIQEYTTNASCLNAVIAATAKRKSYCKALGGSATGLWEKIGEQLEAFREQSGHTLKIPSLRRTVREYKKEGYAALISGKIGNQNTAKIKTGENIVMLEELLKKHNNLDNEQIRSLYNMAAERLGWKTISAGTVANYRAQLDLYTFSGRRGETAFRNSRSMQVKRRAPAFPLYYWTVDGWDVELLYQKPTVNEKGHSVTTYHNRLTSVVILDPCSKYPVGYAIGTHETPELIKAAFRNAANHVRELFGSRFKPLQIQSDRYALKTLTPLYEAMTQYFTPARVKNAKTKVVEPYFKHINKKYCQLLPNWSGHNITARQEHQPNADYLNKIRHSFPDEQGCRGQIEHMIMMERMAKREEYLGKWEKMPEADRLPLSHEEYLNLFGETTGFTNRLEGAGLLPTILGEKRFYDCFDLRFHELRHIDWAVKYDPSDLSTILVVDAETRNGRLVRELDTMRFTLEAKYEQPMALVERREGDKAQLQRVWDWNQNLEERIVERGNQNREVLEGLFAANPQLDGTLTKLVLCDSAGQHKNQRNAPRIEVKEALPPADYEIVEENPRFNY